jgi:parallel beta-helix repeat protein
LNIYGIGLVFSDNNIIKNNMILKNKGGIWPNGAHSNTMTSNTIVSNHWGIILYWYCNRNVISDNTLINNDMAYYESHSHSNTISNNKLSNNNYGIYMFDCKNNILTNNSIISKIYNFMVDGVEPSEFIHDIDSSNTVDGKPIYYVVNQQDMQIPADAGFVGVINSKNITVRDLTLSKNSHGVLFALTTNSRIENVTAINNFYGIQLVHSDNNIINRNTLSNNVDGIWSIVSANNTINNNIVSHNADGISMWAGSRNLIKDNFIINNEKAIILFYSDKNIVSRNIMSNNWDGVWLCQCSSNVICENVISYNNVGICLVSYVYRNAIYHNNIINNRKQTELRWYDNNRWDDGYPSGGNYWSDYIGIDYYSGPNQNISGSDGIGDTPYIVGGNIRDNYPLMYPCTITSDKGEVYAIMPEDLDIISTENDITISFELPLEVVEVFWEDGKLQFGEELYYMESIQKDWVVGVQYILYPITELEMGTYYANATVTAYSETGASITETATGMLTVSTPLEPIIYFKEG